MACRSSFIVLASAFSFILFILSIHVNFFCSTLLCFDLVSDRRARRRAQFATLFE
jgi:hypothetical protein